MTSNPLVDVKNAVFGYGDRAVVRVEGFALVAGRCLGIFGPNGVGKSTLVRGITRLLEPMEGSVEVAEAGNSVRFGYLPQHRAMDRHWPMTALDAASMAISARTWIGRLGRREQRAVRDALQRLGVQELSGRAFVSLSGGQQQRVLLAGALAADPQVLVLDEATEGLDVRSTQLLLDTLHHQTGQGLCAVLISHEVEDLLAVADEVAWLHPPDVPEQPAHIELISPEELAQRVVAVRRAV